MQNTISTYSGQAMQKRHARKRSASMVASDQMGEKTPLTDLQFALPRTMIEQHGRHGYTLELMDGLMPLDELLKQVQAAAQDLDSLLVCLLYTSPSPRDRTRSRMPSSA